MTNAVFVEDKKSERKITDENLSQEFVELFQYIKKNKAIPNFLNFLATPKKETDEDYKKYQEEKEKVQELLNAIQKGDFKAKIFNEPNCYLYLLYLMKNEKNNNTQEKIPFWQGMTIYVYLMAIMQFSKNPHPDLKVKGVADPRPFTVIPLVKNKKLTSAGKEYIKEVEKRFAKFGYQLDLNELQKFILESPPAEQYLLNLDFHPKSDNEIDQFTGSLLKDIFFITQVEQHQSLIHYNVPSSTLINFILNKIPNAVRMMPIFGKINFETLRMLHAQGIQPISLWAPLVKNNPGRESAHSYLCGPIPMWVHDSGHALFGSLQKKEDREYIFERIIPQLRQLRKQAEDTKDEILVRRLNANIDHAGSFCFENLDLYSNPQYPFLEGLAGAFLVGQTGFLINPLFNKPDRPEIFIDRSADLKKDRAKNSMNTVEDRIFFLIKRLAHDPSLNEKDKQIWGKVIDIIEKSYRNAPKGGARKKAVVDALCATAQREFVPPPHEKTPHIDWDYWRKMVAEVESDKEVKDVSKEIWDRAQAERPKEFCALLTFHNVKFYHPYERMDGDKLEQFKKFLDLQVSSLQSVASNYFNSHTKMGAIGLFSTKKQSIGVAKRIQEAKDDSDRLKIASEFLREHPKADISKDLERAINFKNS